MTLRNGKTTSNVESPVKMTPVKHTPKEERSQSNDEIMMRLRNGKVVTNTTTFDTNTHSKEHYMLLLKSLMYMNEIEAKKPNNFSNTITSIINILVITAKLLSFLSPSTTSHLRFADMVTNRSIVWLDDIMNRTKYCIFDAEIKTKIQDLCDKIIIVQMRILTFQLKKDIFENKTEIIQKKINKLCR